MPWVKVDDHFDEHPKLAAVGPLGWGFWLAGLAYSNRNLTDGFIPWSKALSLASFEVIGPDQDYRILALADAADPDGVQPASIVTVEWVFDLLVSAGLWERVANGFHIHDYDQYQPSREAVLAEREAARERMQKVRSARSANTDRSSPEVRPNNRRSSPNPVPVPVPVPSLSPPMSEKDTPLPPKGGSARASRKPDLAGFDQFWRFYPRRVSRADAEKAWAKLNREERGAAIAAIQAQLAWPCFTESPPDKQPHPATWLNGRRWEDEPPQVAIRSPASKSNGTYVNPITEWRRQQEAGRADSMPDAIETHFRVAEGQPR